MKKLSEQERRILMAQHATFAAEFAKGNEGVLPSMKEIEEKLGMTPEQIALEAIRRYQDDTK